MGALSLTVVTGIVVADEEDVLPAIRGQPHAVAAAANNPAPPMGAALGPVLGVAQVGKPLWPPGGQVAHPAAQHQGLAPRARRSAYRRVPRVGLKQLQLCEVQGQARGWGIACHTSHGLDLGAGQPASAAQ